MPDTRDGCPAAQELHLIYWFVGAVIQSLLGIIIFMAYDLPKK